MSACSLALLLLAAAQEAQPEKPRHVALVGGDVYTVTKGTLKGATVLIRDGKIHRVEHRPDLPEGTVKHDVTGKRVLPGFVAADVRELGISGTPGSGRIADVLDPYQDFLQLAVAAGITTFHVESGAASGLFGARASGTPGPTAVLKPTLADLDSMLVLEPASVSLSSWITGTPAQRLELREQLRAARELLETLKDYERRKAEGRLAPGEQAPPAPSPHVRLLRGDSVARIRARTADEIRRALSLVNEFRFRCVLLDVEEAWTLADEIGRAQCFCILTPRSRRAADPNLGRPNGSTIEQAAILKRAGVNFAVATLTEGVSVGGIAGRDLQTLPLEAAFAIRGGLDEQTALEAVTITAARILGVAHRVGSIEEGKDADLVVLDGDPFDYRTWVELTFINGKLLYDRSTSPYFKHFRHK